MIDSAQLQELLKPSGKPVLINFWATWCEPCRDEFPDLVKIDKYYRDRVDIRAVSLDYLSEIDGDVQKFLTLVKAQMPVYPLHTKDETAAYKSVSPDWTGALPMTVLIAPDGKMFYQRMGKFRYETLKEYLDRLLAAPPSDMGIIEEMEFVKVLNGKRDEVRYYYENNWRLYRDAAFKRGMIDSFEYIDVTAPADGAFDIILITRYRGQEQYDEREKNFAELSKELSPKGPFLRGNSKPDAFRKVVHRYVGKPVFYMFK